MMVDIRFEIFSNSGYQHTLQHAFKNFVILPLLFLSVIVFGFNKMWALYMLS